MFLLPFTLFSPSPPHLIDGLFPHRMVIIFRIFCVARGVSLTIMPLIKGAEIENIFLKPGTKDKVLIIDLMPMSWQRLYTEMPKLSLSNKQPLWILKNLKITCQSSLLPLQRTLSPTKIDTCCKSSDLSSVQASYL